MRQSWGEWPQSELFLRRQGRLLLRPRGKAKGLSLEQARLLARTAAGLEGLTKYKDFYLEGVPMYKYPDFYFFYGYIPGTQGSNGHYAVNKFTAEVWDPYSCFRYGASALSKLQKKLRRELGLTEKDYRKHQDDDPCLAGEFPMNFDTQGRSHEMEAQEREESPRSVER